MTPCRNIILSGLPKDELTVLVPYLEVVRLKERSILQHARQPMEYASFVEGGLVSVRTLDSRGILETALVGYDGVVGASAVLGCTLSSFQSVVIAPGSALRIRVEDLLRAMQQHPRIREAMLCHVHELLRHGSQRALCVARHGSQRRVARWLCLACEMLGRRVLPVTQEELSTILGLRRASVAVILKRMESDGLVRRTRGLLEIISLEELDRLGCECHAKSLRSVDAQHVGQIGFTAARLDCTTRALRFQLRPVANEPAPEKAASPC